MVLAASKLRQSNEISEIKIHKKNDEIPIEFLLLGELTTRTLKQAGYTTLKSIAVTPIEKIKKDTNLGKNIVTTLVNNAYASYLQFSSAADVWKERKNLNYLTTMSSNLDEILGFGIEFGTITEVFGASNAGKTQLCHQLCVNVQLSEQEGGVGGSAIYLDLKGDFRPERILEMGLGLKIRNALEKVFYQRLFTTDHLRASLKKIRSIVSEKNVKLVVIEGFITPFLNECDTFESEQNAILTVMGELKQLNALFPDIAIVITNEVSEKTNIMFGDPVYALGSHAVAHNATTRLYLKQSRQEERVIRLIHSPWRPTDEATFLITEEGIRDCPKNESGEIGTNRNGKYESMFS